MANPTPPPTRWPLRQSLNLALHSLVLTEVCPALNPYLSQILAGSARIPQFGDAQVVTGDIPVPAEPMLCIVGVARRNQEISNTTYNATFTTQVRLKTPWVADDAPEDFEVLSSVVMDFLEDCFTSLAHRVILPLSPRTGNPLLPGGRAFTECKSMGSNSLNYTHKAADKVTTYAGAVLMHRAQIQYQLDRPGAL